MVEVELGTNDSGHWLDASFPGKKDRLQLFVPRKGATGDLLTFFWGGDLTPQKVYDMFVGLMRAVVEDASAAHYNLVGLTASSNEQSNIPLATTPPSGYEEAGFVRFDGTMEGREIGITVWAMLSNPRSEDGIGIAFVRKHWPTIAEVASRAIAETTDQSPADVMEMANAMMQKADDTPFN